MRPDEELALLRLDLVERVDNYLEALHGRNLISVNDLRDVLLDIRNMAAPPRKEQEQ